MANIDKLREIWENRPPTSEIALHEEPFFPIFLDIAKKARNILEIGSGTGRMIKILQRNGVKADFYAIDIWARKLNLDSVIQVIGDARCLPFNDNAFDLVYSLGVVEHFPETKQAIFEHFRVLKKGGYVLVTTPRLSPYVLIRWIGYLIKDRKKGTFEEVAGRRLTLSNMNRYFRLAGAQVIFSGPVGFYVPRYYRFWKKYLNRFIPEKIFGAYLYCIGKK